MSTDSPPDIVGGIKVRKSERKKKFSVKGKEYQANMSEAKLKQCFRNKERIFAEAATALASGENLDPCCNELDKL